MDNCYLAGGFGTKIDIKKAAGIGLIPKELEMKTIPAGNTVLAGTKEVLLGRISKEELEKIHKKMISFCEKKANSDDEMKIKSKYIRYEEEVKAGK